MVANRALVVKLKIHLMIYLIEGLPGTGKSTCAERLNHSLARKGVSSILFREYDSLNPFRYRQGTSESTILEDVIKEVDFQWGEFFLEYANHPAVVVQEGMTLQQQINYPIWIDRFSAVRPLISKILNRLRAFDVKMIYLYRKDYLGEFESTMRERGPDWVKKKVEPISNSPFAIQRGLTGKEALRAYLIEIEAQTESCLEECRFPVEHICVSGADWDAVNRKVELFT